MCVHTGTSFTEETYEETNTGPIAMSRQLEVDTIYSCLYHSATVYYLGLVMLIPEKKRTFWQRAEDNGVHYFVTGLILLALCFTHLWIEIT